MSSVHSDNSDNAAAPSMTIRIVMEGIVTLLLAVVLARFFLLDNYTITTGSMAPELRGYHKQVECPECHYSFAFGVKEHDLNGTTSDTHHPTANCPNCGLKGIDVSKIARSHGDQLLVQKQAFVFRQPHRWEVIVFWNSKDIDPPYVKRVVALPGETVQVVKGDVHVSGEICRKKLSTIRAMRIPVYLHDFEPQESANWQSRWVIDSYRDVISNWKQDGQKFILSAANQPPEDVAEVSYHHWVRSGGTHETTVRVESSKEEFILPDRFDQPFHYSKKRGLLTSQEGVIHSNWYDWLMELNEHVPEYAEAINRLAEKSHIAPITDGYGYQSRRGNKAPHVIRDLMMSMKVTLRKGEGNFQLSMTDGRLIAECIINGKSHELKLQIRFPDGTSSIKRTVQLPDIQIGVPFLLELSLVDRQVSVAINKTEVFTPWKYPEKTEEPRWWAKPVWFSASQLDVEVAHLSLYRDVYYTHGRSKNGVSEPFLLGKNEYYFLGDNSPISFDSRSWRTGAVNGDLFIGKPFVVHLPSRPQSFKIGKWKGAIRVPEFSRMKYIR